MMMRRRTAFLSSLLAGLVLVMVPIYAATASADATSANGMKVSPVASNLTINPGETQSVIVNVQNVTNVTGAYSVSINDFTAAPNNESGQPALLLNPGEYAPTHSLKRYVAPIPNVTLKPGEEKAVTVLITIPKGTSGGGYYGAVRFSPVTNGSSNVNLSASVASLILVRVPGNFKEQLNLASLDARSSVNASASVFFTSGKGLVAAIRFQNAGDVQEQPFGKVLLMQGNKQLAEYEVNDSTPRGNVLPDSIRMFTVPLDKVGAFGKYTLLGNFGYGTNGQLISGQTTFYIVPLPAILGVVAIILVILFFIFVFPRMKRAYDRGVLSRSRRR